MMKALSLILLISLCSAQTVTIGTYTDYIIPSVYEINLKANDQVNISLVWKESLPQTKTSDLDVYLYSKGLNLTGSNRVCGNSSIGVSSLICRVPNDGIYYAKIFQYNSKVTTFYNILIKINGVTTLTKASLSYDFNRLVVLPAKIGSIPGCTYTLALTTAFSSKLSLRKYNSTNYLIPYVSASQTTPNLLSFTSVDLIQGITNIVIDYDYQNYINKRIPIKQLVPFTLQLKVNDSVNCPTWTSVSQNSKKKCNVNSIMQIDGSCKCTQDGYVYNYQFSRCQSCAIILTGSILSEDGQQCNCLTGFVKNDARTACRVPCQKIAHADPINVDDSTCKCLNLAVWDSLSKTCKCPVSGCSFCGDGIKSQDQECDNGDKIGCLQCTADIGYNCTGNLYGLSSCTAVCGDSIRTPEEECDNGNKEGCDKCKIVPGFSCKKQLLVPSVCQIKCGDNVRADNQKCDNGGKVGCKTNCLPDIGYTCSGTVGVPSTCTTICGDGIRTESEDCDNGMQLGCTKCKVDDGFQCTENTIGQKSVCNAICGDKKKYGTQQCDNGKNIGCKTCVVERGFICTGKIGQESVCTTNCGDGYKTSVEECDNRNQAGCVNCKIDPNYTCKQIGTLSVCSRK